jgi:nucleotide-binding universal stress UspA family protein
MNSERKILFPTDFSHTGDAAFAMAESLAKERGARLIIVHVEEPVAAYGGGEFYYGTIEPNTAELRKMLEKIVPKDPSVKFEHRLISGDPARAVAHLAEEEKVELIIMGTHGRTGLARMLMGSVAEGIVRRASCPVLTYRQPSGLSAKEGKTS